MKEIRIRTFKIKEYGIIDVTWEDGYSEIIDLREDLKKELFSSINESNFNSIQIIYDGCALGWPDFDVEIGLTRWEEKKVVA